MNFRPAAIIAMSMLMAAGCSQQPAPEAAVEAAPQDSVSETPVVEKAARGGLETPLPEGVVLGFAYHVRNDNIVEKEGKRPRRRVGMEYLEGDQEATFAGIETSLAAAGFELRDRKDLDNGNIRAKFAKRRYGTVVVTVTPEMDARPRNPAAKGRVFLDWPMPKAG